MKNRLISVLISACATLLTACVSTSKTPVELPAAAPLTRLIIGVQSAKPEETKAAWLPLMNAIAKKHGLKTDVIAASQSETVAALRDGTVDVVWLSSSTAIDAVVDAQARAFALYYNINGTNGYKGVLITRSDSGIATLAEALSAGKYSYASGAKTSTSGYVLPQALLFSPRETTPEQLFKKVVYGGHFPNLDALWTKQVDLAVNNTTDLAVFQSRVPEAKAGIRTLWESPLVPNDVLMASRSMSPAHLKIIQEIFLNFGKTDTSEKELYKRASGIDYFVPTDNRILAPVTAFKFGAERTAIQNNETLSSSAKSTALARLNDRLATFNASLK